MESASGDPGGMIDWDLAVRIGSRVAGQGPKVGWSEAADVVAQLRAGAERSSPLVREFTGLVAQERTAPVLVVDRSGWVKANADAFSQILAPIVTKLRGKRATGRITDAIGSRVTGTEVGLMLGFLGGKVLGQFDPFHTAPGAHGRLLLVAPNIVHVERALDAVTDDFRLWVCLHEETHRVQFTAVPWMRDYLHGLMEEITTSIGDDLGKTLTEGLSRIGDLVSGKAKGSLLDLVSTPEQKEIIDRVTGVMSLLEGHADVVMDGVGPEVIPTVSDIRAKFTQRRQGVGSLDRILRRLLGLEQKMAQYRDGAVFVREVVDTVGMDGFNAVFAEPANLPTHAEVLAPRTWLDRVHG